MAVSHHFTRFAAIDWSGAKGTRHPGIAVALCEAGDAAPRLVSPPSRAWSRHEVLDWVLEQANDPLLIGFDFSFSAPFVGRDAHLPGETQSDDARALWAHRALSMRDAGPISIWVPPMG